MLLTEPLSLVYLHCHMRSTILVFTGCHLAKLPVDPKVGKMLLMEAVFQCLGPALTIAAGLAQRDPLVLPLEHKEGADETPTIFAGESRR